MSLRKEQNAIEKVHNSINFNKLSYHYRDPTADINFDNFIDAITLFNEIKSTRIKLNRAKKENLMDFKSKLSDIRIGDRKSDKQNSEIKSTTNLYNAQDCCH